MLERLEQLHCAWMFTYQKFNDKVYDDPDIIQNSKMYSFSPPLSIQRRYEYKLSRDVITLYDEFVYNPFGSWDEKLFISSSEKIILEQTTSKNKVTQIISANSNYSRLERTDYNIL